MKHVLTLLRDASVSIKLKNSVFPYDHPPELCHTGRISGTASYNRCDLHLEALLEHYRTKIVHGARTTSSNVSFLI